MNRRVLLVDDEPPVLESLRRQLAGTFDVETAPGPREGLERIHSSEPFAVVVSDMRMPVMTGAAFLEEVRKCRPDSVRMILTGHADLESTITAVNVSHVFRFHTKPCQRQDFVAAVQACVEQYELVAARRVLLEQTLHGTVRVLTEILALTNPAAQQRANRIARYAEKICAALKIDMPWQLRIALMLSQIGCITLPQEILACVLSGRPLSDEARALYRSHPALAARLLSDIPRLEVVARIIAHQLGPPVGTDDRVAPGDQDVVRLGGAVLKIATDLEDAFTSGVPRERALRKVLATAPQLQGDLPRVLESLDFADVMGDTISLRVRELRSGMVLDEDLYSTEGMLLLSHGQEVTRPILLRLQALAQSIGVREPFRVRLAPAS
jgi:CheY-like chemotaxis protein